MTSEVQNKAHDGLWELTPLTLFTLTLTLCNSMNTLFYNDCLGHQELENIAYDGQGVFREFVSRDGWDGTDHTP